MLWSCLNKFKLFTTYNNHVVRGGQLKNRITSGRLSHVQHLESVKNIKTSENILKYTNFISRNVILNFYKIDIYLLFTLNDRPFVPAAPVKFHTTWNRYIRNLHTKVIKRPI